MLDGLTVEEIRQDIEEGRCSWCHDDRRFQALGLHLVKLHEIDLDELRDRLIVPRRFSFCSPDLSEKHSERNRRLGLVEATKGTQQGPKVLTAYGKAAHRERGLAMNEYLRQHPEVVEKIVAVRRTHPAILANLERGRAIQRGPDGLRRGPDGRFR